MFRKTALSLCFALLLSTLTACGSIDLLRNNNGESNNDSSAASPENNAKNSIGSPIAIPPSYGETPNNASNMAASAPEPVMMPNGLPALKPMKGVNIETLFSEQIKDTDKRFHRVENAVVDLRKEFDTYKPSIVRLAAVETDIQDLIKELEVLLQETPQQPQPSSSNAYQQPDEALQALNHAPTNLAMDGNDGGADDYMAQEPPTPLRPTPPKTQSPPPAPPKPYNSAYKVTPDTQATLADNIIPDMRVGEHSDKIRIVIDLTSPSKYTIDLDNDEKLILIEIPDARWDTQKRKQFQDSAILEAYSVEPVNNGKGSMLILSLKRSTKILTQNTLTPDNTSKFHRIYFDLAL